MGAGHGKQNASDQWSSQDGTAFTGDCRDRTSLSTARAASSDVSPGAAGPPPTHVADSLEVHTRVAFLAGTGVRCLEIRDDQPRVAAKRAWAPVAARSPSRS